MALVHVLRPAIAINVGCEFEVDASIGRESELADDVKRVVDPNGQSAKTRFRVLSRGVSIAIVSATLVESGRTHQIRVHAAHSGLPLVGHGLYGGEDQLDIAHINRVALHAWRLSILHPTRKEKMQIAAPLPQDMIDCCRAHGVEWAN